MTKEFAKGQQPVTSVEDFLKKKDAKMRRPAGGALRDRGPYGYGGGPPMVTTSDSAFDSSKFIETAAQQRRVGFRNSFYERNKRHIPKPTATTDPIVLPFNKEPKNH